jgi:hypothetical protein
MTCSSRSGERLRGAWVGRCTDSRIGRQIIGLTGGGTVRQVPIWPWLNVVRLGIILNEDGTRCCELPVLTLR